MLLVGPAGVGKSTLQMQASLCWGIGREFFGIHPARPLKSLHIQSENDHGDLAEMRDGVLDIYDREPRVKAGMCRADFRTLQTLIERKADVTTMGLNKALGQCWFYKAVAGEDCIIMMQDNVHLRYEWLIVFKRMGVRVFSESSFVQMLSGFLPLDGVMPRELTFLRLKKR